LISDKTIVAGDVDGNKIADFQIELSGLDKLDAEDFAHRSWRGARDGRLNPILSGLRAYSRPAISRRSSRSRDRVAFICLGLRCCTGTTNCAHPVR
jgi:hypothetical protein